jgi:arginase family enzyme
VSARVVILRGRTSDRTEGGARGALALGRRLSPAAVEVGMPEPPRTAGWQDDLRDSGAAIAAAGEQLGAAFDAGELPLLLASDCSICLATLPVLARRAPDAHVVWLDAHGDFNTPATTGSGFLGGMCLAAPCGLWDSGFGAGLDPRHVVMSDGRDLDDAERELLDRAEVRIVPPAGVADAVRGERVFLHLDFDILDPGVMPAAVPAPNGLTAEALTAVLAELAAAAELVGAELTAFDAPADPGERERLADLLADTVESLQLQD